MKSKHRMSGRRKSGHRNFADRNFRHGVFSILFAGTLSLWICFGGAKSWAKPAGQAFTGTGAPLGVEGTAVASGVGLGAAADSPDSGLFADGTKAINESRWADAAKIFASVAGLHGEHIDGALYWKAYAEDKLGKSKASEESCKELRGSYPKSPWNEDCGALEVEIRAKTGKPIEIDPGASDDLKLLALNAMMRQDEPRALAEMQAILNGDASEKLKKEAQFILGQHYSDITYAQIVRIRSVEGDVRIQRGEAGGKSDSAAWEKAVADLPLETGFSLVTGEGRAEIEFENASTLYLGENSVLTFNDLHETAGIPYTDIALLSGTVSLHVHPYVAGEKFVLRTPTDNLFSKYPDKTYARVESFTDGLAISPLEGGELRLPGVPREDVKPGRTWTYREGQLWAEETAGDVAAFADWDKWVADHVAQRDEAIAGVMEASGLPAPIPGMAEMAGQGKFFECAPYGTCWEPNDEVDSGDEAAARQPSPQPAWQTADRGPAHLMLASYHPPSLRAASLQATPLPLRRAADWDDSFPCMPGVLRYRTMKDPVTGRQTVVQTGLGQTHPYNWAVCHAGSWVRHKKHYVWAASCRRRHVDPVRWVKSGHTIAFVPLHPYDVKGQPPINIKHEVFEVSGKGEIQVRPIKLETAHPIQFLEAPPKEYRTALLRPLSRLEAPRMEAHALGIAAPGRVDLGKAVAVSRPAVPLRFDPHSLSFAMQKQEMRGGKSETVFAPITNRGGTLQAHGETFSGGSGFHGGASSSGGSHGGGGSSGGGGGSHSGGGGSSSSSSGSSSSSSSSSSSGGGSHH